MDGQRAILAVKWGLESGRKAVIEPGAVVRVGRAEWADLMVPHDRKMSGVHFEVAWDGAVCRVKDLEGAGGTLIDGEPGRAEGELASGGWIKAGDTVFTLHVEGKAPAREPPREIAEDDELPGVEDDEDRRWSMAERRRAEEARRAAAEIALKTLYQAASGGELFAVLDAARDPRIVELCDASTDEHRSLYDGLGGELLADVAPYLVHFGAKSGLLPQIVREGWGRRWGIFVSSALPFRDVRRHFRRFLMVDDDESGERLYFRFYDPAVLRVFVPAANAAQSTELFRDVSAFFAEGESGEVARLEGGSGEVS